MKSLKSILFRGVLLCVGGILSLSADVFAEPGLDGSGSQELWLLAKYDVNGDKVISMGEISDKRQKLFTNMDYDQSGDVNFDEYAKLDSKKRRLLLKARFQKLDLNMDGEVSNEEYSSYIGSFDRYDLNGDGNLTAAEMKGKDSKNEKPVAKKDTVANAKCLLWVCIRPSI